MEGGPLSICSSRLRAAHIRLEQLQQCQGWRAVGFQNVALALAPRTFVLKLCNSFKDGWRFLFKTGRAPETAAQIMIPELEICNNHTVEGGWF